MQPFNDTRYKGIDILKNYYKKVTEVPEPQEYYAVTFIDLFFLFV